MSLEHYEPNMQMIPFGEVEKMATAIAASKLFGVKTKEQALGLMLISQAEGRHPAEAARDYHIIDGRASLKADTMLARFQAVGGKVAWVTYTEKEAKATFSHPSGGSLEVSWTIGMAKDAGLTGKDNWKKYPRAMLKARCISEGIRTVFPGVLAGMYTPEEVGDFVPEQEPAQQAEVVETGGQTITEIVDPPFDIVDAVAKIMAVLPPDDAETKIVLETFSVIVPDCSPSAFRSVMDECLVDQIKDRNHAGDIYKALRGATTSELYKKFEDATIPDGQPD